MVKKAKDDEMRSICSACFTSVPIEQTHVQPGYNDHLRAYVTCYRCEGCRTADLEKTRGRIAACTDAEELSTGELFFARYGVPLPDLGPEPTLEAVRDGLLALVDRLISGDLRIRIDPKTAVPIDLPPDFGPPGKDPPGGSLGSWLPPG
ncbi:MAG: hypothetical protein K2X87_10715 [Gemmataceae bacterium]|nr:hypothetical protein [Gemmataceae bacterium]